MGCGPTEVRGGAAAGAVSAGVTGVEVPEGDCPLGRLLRLSAANMSIGIYRVAFNN